MLLSRDITNDYFEENTMLIIALCAAAAIIGGSTAVTIGVILVAIGLWEMINDVR